MSDTVETMAVPLTALDRCDRCGAQAWVRAQLEAGTELLFCGHHWTEHHEAVAKLEGVKIHDETEQLKAGSTASS